MDGSLYSQRPNAISLVVSSLLFGIVLMVKFYGTTVAKKEVKATVAKPIGLYVFYTSGIVFLVAATNRILSKMVYDGKSDIIPNIRILAQRVLSHKPAYALEAWFATSDGKYYPFYLPMHWLPFTISELFHFDPRWIPFAVWLAGVALIVGRVRKYEENWLRIGIPLLFIASYLLMANNYGAVVGVTVEPLIFGYYLLFILMLNQTNFMLTGIVFGCCLLSRFYIAGWLPLWCFVLFLSGKRKELYRTILVTMVFVLVAYVIPFAIWNWDIVRSIGNGYDLALKTEWTLNLDLDGHPNHLYEGKGFAFAFYEHYRNTDMKQGFFLLKKMLMVIPLLSVVAMGIVYWFLRRKIDYRIFLMASFKIYLTVFLSLLTVPYTYLSAIAIFVSIAIFSEQAMYELTDDIIG